MFEEPERACTVKKDYQGTCLGGRCRPLVRQVVCKKQRSAQQAHKPRQQGISEPWYAQCEPEHRDVCILRPYIPAREHCGQLSSAIASWLPVE